MAARAGDARGAAHQGTRGRCLTTSTKRWAPGALPLALCPTLRPPRGARALVTRLKVSACLRWVNTWGAGAGAGGGPGHVCTLRGGVTRAVVRSACPWSASKTHVGRRSRARAPHVIGQDHCVNPVDDDAAGLDVGLDHLGRVLGFGWVGRTAVRCEMGMGEEGACAHALSRHDNAACRGGGGSVPRPGCGALASRADRAQRAPGGQ